MERWRESPDLLAPGRVYSADFKLTHLLTLWSCQVYYCHRHPLPPPGRPHPRRTRRDAALLPRIARDGCSPAALGRIVWHRRPRLCERRHPRHTRGCPILSRATAEAKGGRLRWNQRVEQGFSPAPPNTGPGGKCGPNPRRQQHATNWVRQCTRSLGALRALRAWAVNPSVCQDPARLHVDGGYAEAMIVG